MNNKILCVYEKYIPFGTPPWVYWSIISIASFFIGDLLIRQFNDNRYFETQILFSAMIAAIPLSFIWLSNNFQTSLRSLSIILWDSNEEFEMWLEERAGRIFTLQSPIARLVILGATTFAIITVLYF